MADMVPQKMGIPPESQTRVLGFAVSVKGEFWEQHLETGMLVLHAQPKKSVRCCTRADKGEADVFARVGG